MILLKVTTLLLLPFHYCMIELGESLISGDFYELSCYLLGKKELLNRDIYFEEKEKLINALAKPIKNFFIKVLVLSSIAHLLFNRDMLNILKILGTISITLLISIIIIKKGETNKVYIKR